MSHDSLIIQTVHSRRLVVRGLVVLKASVTVLGLWLDTSTLRCAVLGVRCVGAMVRNNTNGILGSILILDLTNLLG